MNAHQRRLSRRFVARTGYTYGPLQVWTYPRSSAEPAPKTEGKSWDDFRGEHRPDNRGITFVGRWYEVPATEKSRPELRDWAEIPRIPQGAST